MRAHRRCLLIIVILLLFSAYELYVKWTELTPLPIVVENVVSFIGTALSPDL